MRYLIRLVVTAALTAYASWALAADLAGAVRNQQGQPRPGVEVNLRGTEPTTENIARSTTATGAGEFVFSKIPPGAYKLTCGSNQPTDFSAVLFRPHFMLASEGCPMKVHKNQWLRAIPYAPECLAGATRRGHTMVPEVQTPSQGPDMGRP
jgi:hypothetical protein